MGSEMCIRDSLFRRALGYTISELTADMQSAQRAIAGINKDTSASEVGLVNKFKEEVIDRNQSYSMLWFTDGSRQVRLGRELEKYGVPREQVQALFESINAAHENYTTFKTNTSSLSTDIVGGGGGQVPLFGGGN